MIIYLVNHKQGLKVKFPLVAKYQQFKLYPNQIKN